MMKKYEAPELELTSMMMTEAIARDMSAIPEDEDEWDA